MRSDAAPVLRLPVNQREPKSAASCAFRPAAGCDGPACFFYRRHYEARQAGSSSLSDKAVSVYAAMLDSISRPIILCSADGRVLLSNSSARSLFPLLSGDEAPGSQSIQTFLEGKSRLPLLRMLDAACKGSPVPEQFRIFVSQDGIAALPAAASLHRMEGGEGMALLELSLLGQDNLQQKKNAGMVIHNLKNHVITTDSLRNELKESKEFAELADIGHESASTIMRQVNEYLRSTMAGNDAVEIPEFSSFDAISSAASAIEKFPSQGVVLLNGLQPEDSEGLGRMMVTQSMDHVKMILDNLLSNALKYSPKELPVEVTVRGVGGFAEFSVRDYGSGVPDADVPLLFVSGTVTSNATEFSSHFGLPLSKKIAGSLAGALFHRAPADGKGGAEFVLRLPDFS